MSKTIVSVILLCISASCATPSQRYSKIAKNYHMSSLLIRGNPFLQRLYLSEKIPNNKHRKILHIYIDGDGTPWEQGRWLSTDPTSRNPLVLKMMKADPDPAILLGRPCYHGLKDPACHSKFWTSHRYSQVVVNSMSTALTNWLQFNSYLKLVLIGYSGGGTLAVLIAAKLKKISCVMTVAANLDTAAWSRFHTYPPLSKSLNPMVLPPLPQNIKQIHFVGQNDNNVPAWIVKKFVEKQPDADFVSVAGFDHHCCWADAWKEMLKQKNCFLKN